MNHRITPAVLAASLALATACHNQSTQDDRGQAAHGPAPDSRSIPPQPMVATPAGPVASVPAANLARTVPPGPPNHDGPAVCHVAIGNETTEGRAVITENTGNVPIRACDAVVYVYNAARDQIARVELSLFKADAGAALLAPRDAIRRDLPVARAIAEDNDDLFVPVVVHVDFADGARWSAPPDRAPARRPFSEVNRRDAIN